MVDTPPHSRSSLRRVQLAKKRWEEHKILLKRIDGGVKDTVNTGNGSRRPQKDSNSEDTAPENPVEETRKEAAAAGPPRDKATSPAGLNLTPSSEIGNAKTSISFGLTNGEGKHGSKDGLSIGHGHSKETQSVAGFPSVP
ncbi:hypothetical protein THAOC_25283, partial [Thalassiosira oceanica]